MSDPRRNVPAPKHFLDLDLLDGSTLRTPSIEVYTASGESFENYGVPPDVYVDNTPEDFLSGHDRQIEKAVEVLKSEMASQK